MTTLEAEIAAYMTGLADDDDATWCDDCGESVAPSYADRHDGLCPRCHHQARVDDAEGDLAEAESDLEGLLEELNDVKERIAEARRAAAAARRKLEKLQA